MKKFLSLLTIAVMAFATACTKDDEDSFKAKVTTLDATEISFDYFTLNGTLDWSCEANCYGEAGFFVGSTPDVSAEKYFVTTTPVELGKKTVKDNFSYQFKNLIGLDIIGIHAFDAGETCYYRAYIHAVSANKSDYIYGEVKSFTVPGK